MRGKGRQVTTNTFIWPTEFLLCALAVSAIAVVLPWCCLRWRFQATLALGLPALSYLVWLAYEQHLAAIARPGDPLIRLDLIVLKPAIVFAWVSGVVSMVVAANTRKARE